MCTVSMVMDHYTEKWTQPSWVFPATTEPAVTDEEIREFRSLIERARKYDKDNGEPDCELQEKRERLHKIVAELGKELSFL